MAFGNDHGLVVIDLIHRLVIWNASSAELYGSQDPYCRSPRRTHPDSHGPMAHSETQRSPSIDQV